MSQKINHRYQASFYALADQQMLSLAFPQKINHRYQASFYALPDQQMLSLAFLR
jgi:phosphatidylethanolamine-binding protein (PEBP) family uncharacterized protein